MQDVAYARFNRLGPLSLRQRLREAKGGGADSRATSLMLHRAFAKDRNFTFLGGSLAMASVRDIVARKGNHIETIAPNVTVFEAAVYMTEKKIGALLILDEGRLVGIITERDILQRVVAKRRDVGETLVEEVMTTEIACCQSDTSIEEARGVMKNRRIRHLPVVDGDDRLLALISIGDLNAYQTTTQEQTIHLLHEYIYGIS